VVGETPRELLGRAIPVAARAGDQQAATFAQGALAAGEAKLTLGTAAMLDLNVGDTPVFPGPGTFPLALWRVGGRDAFCLEASVITAGAVVDWLVGLGLLPEAAAFDRVAGQVASAEGVAFVPALQGLGTPHFDDGARGLLGGLTRGSTAAHVVRAVLEGLAHRCVDLCDALDLEREQPLRVDGGLARSDLLLQRLADLSGRPVLRAAETETTALGAAFLAGLGAGVYDDASQCAALAVPPGPFEPAAEPGLREQERRRWQGVVERCREQPAHAAVR
jgi:glycerol kinase